MGKGQRAHLDFQPPLSSADILPKGKEVVDAAPAIFQPDVAPQELDHNIESVPLIHLITTYLSYFILIVVGHIRDFIRKRLYPEKFAHFSVKDGYAPITTGFGT
jgi:serine palmitoyltransferase